MLRKCIGEIHRRSKKSLSERKMWAMIAVRSEEEKSKGRRFIYGGEIWPCLFSIFPFQWGGCPPDRCGLVEKGTAHRIKAGQGREN